MGFLKRAWEGLKSRLVDVLLGSALLGGALAAAFAWAEHLLLGTAPRWAVLLAGSGGILIGLGAMEWRERRGPPNPTLVNGVYFAGKPGRPARRGPQRVNVDALRRSQGPSRRPDVSDKPASYYNPIDVAECARIRQSLSASMTHYRLSPDPRSTLGRMLAAADRGTQARGLESQDEEMVRLLGQAQHVARCLDWFKRVRDKDNVITWVRRGLDRLSDPTSKGLDRLLEIEMAGALARHGAFDVSTEEPDVVAVAPFGARLRLACKHPDTHAGLKRGIKEGAKQIGQFTDPGIVVANVETVVQRGSLVRVAYPDDAPAWGVQRLGELEQRIGVALRKGFERPQVVGVVLVLRVGFIASQPSMLSFWPTAKAFHNPGLEGSRESMSSVVRFLLG
jgi:hypothetical protein